MTRYSRLTAAPTARLRPGGVPLLLAGSALVLIAGCSRPLDLDLRGMLGSRLDTASAAQGGTTARPNADARGIISYPNYQVAVAQRGDTLADLARRIGVDAGTLASYNGISTGDRLREGEIIALPGRVAEPSAATGAVSAGSVDISTLAGGAIDRAGGQQVTTTTLDSAPTSAQPQTGREPTRHKVARGETAYTVARLYGVSVRALADWNGLGSDFSIREGQYLLIPVVADQAAAPRDSAELPGSGSQTPTPPSAKTPLPAEKTVPAAAPVVTTATAATAATKPAATTPDLGKTETKASTARMTFPVQGNIIREYVKGKTDGIDIAAASGTGIKAADAGTVAAITSDADQVPIIVVKHANNLLTVYANVDGIKVQKGDSVSRGQQIAAIRSGSSNYVHFEVRKGFDSVDPLPYLQD